MKKLIVLSTLFVGLLFTNNTYAKIWRVNNTAGVVADFTDVNAAITAASAGDTIHIEPSLNSYGNISVNKTLVLIGNGNFLSGANGNAGLQANVNQSSCNYVDFVAGSANSSVYGMYCNYMYTEDNNILVKRNYIYYYVYLYTAGNNCTFSGNIFVYGITTSTSPATIYVGNNIMSSCTMSPTSTGTFENNICTGGTINVSNCQVDNNIMSAGAFTPNNSVYFNNIGNSTQFGTANGNQQNVNMATVFVGGASTDGQYVLAGGSPAIGAGYLGVDCGAYGNVNPYKLSTIPSVPTIYSLTVPPVGTNTINVTISTRSNN